MGCNMGARVSSLLFSQSSRSLVGDQETEWFAEKGVRDKQSGETDVGIDGSDQSQSPEGDGAQCLPDLCEERGQADGESEKGGECPSGNRSDAARCS